MKLEPFTETGQRGLRASAYIIVGEGSKLGLGSIRVSRWQEDLQSFGSFLSACLFSPDTIGEVLAEE